VSDSIPVAYRDLEGWYKTDRFFNKATSQHLNKWLKDRPHVIVSHDLIVQAFEALAVHTPDRRQTERRALQDTSDPVDRLAEALRAVLMNGRA
jgi:hypothetical protein